MRLLQLAFIVALTSGLAAIYIYTTGVSDFCKCINPLIYMCVWTCHGKKVCCLVMVELIWCADGPHQVSDEDLEAFRSLQRGFQKCVVSFPHFVFVFLLFMKLEFFEYR